VIVSMWRGLSLHQSMKGGSPIKSRRYLSTPLERGDRKKQIAYCRQMDDGGGCHNEVT
jgi:hypothetical protein